MNQIANFGGTIGSGLSGAHHEAQDGFLTLADQSVWEQRLGEARIGIEMARLLCLKAADLMDKTDNKTARLEIAMIKVAAPRTALRVIDYAMQAHGAGGLSDDFGLAQAYAGMRTLRIADGPDEVHLRSIARMELAKVGERMSAWRDRAPVM